MITPQKVYSQLAERATRTPQYGLQQFRSCAGAGQYRWAYGVTQKFLATPQHVLDWGCGNGHFSWFLRQAGHEVDAFAFGEPTPLVQELAVQPGLRYTPGSVDSPVQLPYANEQFDAVVSVGVLEHVRETGGTETGSLREVYRTLKDNALFLCFHFPNRYSWIEGLTFFFRSRHHHQFRYTAREIHQLAADAGFEVLALRRYNILPRNMYGDLPDILRRSRLLAQAVDLIDTLLALPLRPFCQNFGFVLRKIPLRTSPSKNPSTPL